MIVKEDVGRESVNWESGVGISKLYTYINIFTGWLNEVLLEHRELYTT